MPNNMVWDNTDRLEENLSGEGTSQRVYGILVQETYYEPSIAPPSTDIPKSNKRSLQIQPKYLAIFNSSHRIEPPQVTETSADQFSNIFFKA